MQQEKKNREEELERKERLTDHGAVALKLKLQLDDLQTEYQSPTVKSCTHRFLEMWTVANGHEWHCGGCKALIVDSARIAKEEALSKLTIDEDITAFGEKGDDVDGRNERAGESSFNRGVSVKWLIRFTTEHEIWQSKTWQVKQEVIQPMTERTRCRYVDLDAMRDNNTSIVGPADIFVSHCWRFSTFSYLSASPCRHRAPAPAVRHSSYKHLEAS